MRLKQIADILEKNLTKLSIAHTLISPNIKVDKLVAMRIGIDNIEKTGLFKNEIFQLKATQAYASTLDSLTMSSNDFNHLSSLVNSIRSGGSIFLNSINENTPINYSENIISIKLPDKMDLEDLSKIIELLKKSLSIPLAESKVNEKIEIEAFENGSFWIDVLVQSGEAVTLIAAITWAGAFINKQISETKIHWAYIESLTTKNDHLKDLKETAKKQMDLLVEIEAQNILSDYYDNPDPEKAQRVMHSIESMSKLIEKGTEVHPSLLASESLKSAFPSFKNLNLIESKTKQIKNE